MSDIRPFQIEITQDEMDDLRVRLERTRLTDELSYLRPLVEHWRSGFDWRKTEASLNEFPQFVTDIDGQRVHFVHIRSAEPDATPLILTHGWPNTFVEYLNLVGPLTDPRAYDGDAADAFDVVIPTIPGFGFSEAPKTRGWGPERVARAWAELMARLGYERYGAVGNDAGAIIAPWQGRVDSDHVLGVHVTQIYSFPSGDPADLAGLNEEEQEQLAFSRAFNDEMSACARLQATKPRNQAHALADSPAGQLAWMSQVLGTAVDRDTLLTIASIYWFTNAGGSSARFYCEDRHGSQPSQPAGPTTVPIGLASFQYDFQPVRRFVIRDHSRLMSWISYDRGGHWSAHDAPDLLYHDIRLFFRGLLDNH